ncbi:MAG: 2,3,4,5-tetrahydropyridine-2,6-dicarboxylate N-succinyltransferase [Proteobacteria bacterium]|nr:2,3,4,5-tetrahydropyridine-2,6-dicarboxylate N-succinyltransferase [Pseudomonadota bacterium]
MNDQPPERALIEQAYATRELLERPGHRRAVARVIEQLDRGELRVASPPGEPGGEWITHAWIKQAVLLYFATQGMQVIECGPFEYHDKIPLKRGLDRARVRVVPPGTIRYGAHVEPGAVLMPGYVNIGAYVGARSMVDTWATVGSCAQIGCDVHLSGGVGIGGVLEPLTRTPVIIEDGAFIGSRAVVVEGVRVGSEAVLGANVVLTASTVVLDVTGPEPLEMRGYVPERSVVIPGMRTKRFSAGDYQIPCALIIGKRSEHTDRKVSLNNALREHGLAT